MDYWDKAHIEIRKCYLALECIEDKSETEISFIVHATEFNGNGPIPNYPKWSDDLRPYRDRVSAENGNQIIVDFAIKFTDLVWRWAYGGMELEGYEASLAMSALFVPEGSKNENI